MPLLAKFAITRKIPSFAQRPSEPQLIDALPKARNNPGYHAGIGARFASGSVKRKLFVRHERQGHV
jgi:hypothetical protein